MKVGEFARRARVPAIEEGKFEAAFERARGDLLLLDEPVVASPAPAFADRHKGPIGRASTLRYQEQRKG